jgi:hypothetical protein
MKILSIIGILLLCACNKEITTPIPPQHTISFTIDSALTSNGTEFTSDIINRFETQYPIYADVDDWNVKSIRLFKKLGFRVV